MKEKEYLCLTEVVVLHTPFHESLLLVFAFFFFCAKIHTLFTPLSPFPYLRCLLRSTIYLSFSLLPFWSFDFGLNARFFFVAVPCSPPK